MLHINLNGALYIKNDFFLFFYSFWGAFEIWTAPFIIIIFFIVSIFFWLLAFNFSYIKYVSPLPHPLKCAPPSPGPIFSLFHFGYTLHHRIFTAILTCSTIRTLPSGSQKKKRKIGLKCTTTPKMAFYWFFFSLFLFEYTIIFVVIIKL